MTRLRRPRWAQRAWARVFGYFWAPCPECGEMYGGHETALGGVHVDTGDGSFVVCRACGPVVSARNMAEILERLNRGQS